jgi:ADP-heptose:LPS heptosyltransferase
MPGHLMRDTPSPDLIDLQSMRRIAVFRALYLGDLLLSIPALRALRAACPAAEIVFVGLPWAREFLERFGYTDGFVEFPGYPGIKEVPYDPERTAAFMRRIEAEPFDLAIQLHGDGSISNAFVSELGARWSVGFVRPGAPCPLTVGVPYPGDDAHELLKQLALLDAIGVPSRGTALELPLRPEDFDELRGDLGDDTIEDGPIIAIHPGSKAPSRRWSPDRYAALADALVDEFGARIVLTGGEAERPLAAYVESSMRRPALNLVGKTSLGALGALLSCADLFVGNDTGPSHLAVAVDCPSVMLFGPGNIRRWQPLDQTRHAVLSSPADCSPCEHWECPIDHRCFGRTSVERVLDAVRSLRSRCGLTTWPGLCETSGVPIAPPP